MHILIFLECVSYMIQSNALFLHCQDDDSQLLLSVKHTCTNWMSENLAGCLTNCATYWFICWSHLIKLVGGNIIEALDWIATWTFSVTSQSLHSHVSDHRRTILVFNNTEMVWNELVSSAGLPAQTKNTSVNTSMFSQSTAGAELSCQDVFKKVILGSLVWQHCINTLAASTFSNWFQDLIDY